MNIAALLQTTSSVDDLRVVVFPAALLLYYFVCWLLVGRDPKIENVAPQYEAPAGITPGVARYVVTGGSDGTTLAAVLASLAVKGVISIQPADGAYRVTLLNDKTSVMPEEAAVLKSLVGAELPVDAYPGTNTTTPANVASPQEKRAPMFAEAFGDDMLEANRGTGPPHVPAAGSETLVEPQSKQIEAVLGAVQETFRNNLQGIYFRWNFAFVAPGMIATFAWAMIYAFRVEATQASPVFLTFWLLCFTSIAGVVIGGVWTSRPGHPTPAQRIKTLLVPILFFLLPGSFIYFALPTAHLFVLALLASVALNNIFLVLMRAPTAEGRRVLQQLAGFREFLLRVEQDRLDRVNSSSEKTLMAERFLPYAIALGVREGWGDAMASAFSNVVVER